MGKGDKRSKRGKIWKGTFGVNRPRVKTDAYVATTKEAVEEAPAKKPAPKPKAAAKKAPAKKAPAKKTTAKAASKEVASEKKS
jgi:ribosomal small subunit protein bTHX